VTGAVIDRLKQVRWDFVRATQVARLAGGPADAARIMWAWPALSAKAGARRSNGALRVSWRSAGAAFSAALPDISALWVLREVFLLEHYDLPADVQPSVIVDLGSNVGISVLYFAARFPQARILAVEADPNTFRLLEDNTAHLDQVTRVHAAITDHDGDVDLYAGTESWGSSIMPAPEHSTRHVVPALTLDGLAKLHGIERIDLLKMDIEGAEAAVIRSARTLREADTVIFEFHREHSDEDLWALLDPLPREHLRVVGDSDTHALVTLRSEAGKAR
jgi:FkbM family methyltransferase